MKFIFNSISHRYVVFPADELFLNTFLTLLYDICNFTTLSKPPAISESMLPILPYRLMRLIHFQFPFYFTLY